MEGVDKVHPKVQASFDWISWFWGSTGIPECNQIWELCNNARTSWNTQECFNLWSNIQRLECFPLQPHGWGFFLFCCYSAGREKWWFTLLNEWWHLLLFCVCQVWCGGGSPPWGCAPIQPIGISLCNNSSQFATSTRAVACDSTIDSTWCLTICSSSLFFQCCISLAIFLCALYAQIHRVPNWCSGLTQTL